MLELVTSSVLSKPSLGFCSSPLTLSEDEDIGDWTCPVASQSKPVDSEPELLLTAQDKGQRAQSLWLCSLSAGLLIGHLVGHISTL